VLPAPAFSSALRETEEKTGNVLGQNAEETAKSVEKNKKKDFVAKKAFSFFETSRRSVGRETALSNIAKNKTIDFPQVIKEIKFSRTKEIHKLLSAPIREGKGSGP
jgi:hypothetical protein